MTDVTETPPRGGSRRGKKSADAFRTISEVSKELDVPQHVLRFWESKFAHVRPMKRGGGRRYYRPQDIQLISRIRDLLYVEGYTIKGVQRLLRESGLRAVMAEASAEDASAANEPAEAGPALTPDRRREVQSVIAELSEIRKLLTADPE